MAKRVCILLLALALLCALLPSSALDARAETRSGECGPNVTWTLNPVTGVLRIQGTGEMSYGWFEELPARNAGEGTASSLSPWAGDPNVRAVVIEEGVTSIDYAAFRGCENLVTVVIPSTVKTIEAQAFMDCTNLYEVGIINGVNTIQERAFYNCKSLPRLTLPDSVTVIGGTEAFCGCDALERIFIRNPECALPQNASWDYGPILDQHTTVVGPANSTVSAFAADWGLTFVALEALDCHTEGDVWGRLGWNGGNCLGDRESGEPVMLYTCLDCGYAETQYGISYEDRFPELPDTPVIVGDDYTDLEKLWWYGDDNSLTYQDGASHISAGGRFRITYDHDSGHEMMWSETRPYMRFVPASSGKYHVILEDDRDNWYEGSAHGLIADRIDLYDADGFRLMSAVSSSDGCAPMLECDLTAGRAYYFFIGCGLENCYTGYFEMAAYLEEGPAAPKILLQPENAAVDQGESTEFYLKAIGGNLAYQWEYSKDNGASWTEWSGKTAPMLKVIGSATNNGCLYRCVVTELITGNRLTSNPAALTVRASAKPTITAQPKSVSVALGKTATFQVTAVGDSLRYQWQYRKAGTSTWIDWSGKTAAALTVTASATNGGCQYRCVVSNAYGSVTSAAATLTVTGDSAKPVITAHPKNASAAKGKTVTLQVTATGSGLKYQWQYMKSGKTEWTTWSGMTAASLKVTASATNNGCKYRCVVSNSAGSVTSSAAMLTVTDVGPAILSQPKNASAAKGKTVTFTVSAAGSNVKYQWQYRKSGKTEWTTWSGKTANSVTVTASDTNNGCQYRCKISNAYGSGNSAAAMLTVTDVKPAILKQPVDASAAKGKTVTFTISAAGSNLKYQWQYRKIGETAWHNWSGKTEASLKVTASATNNGCQYRCYISNAYGGGNSAAVTLTVTDVQPVIRKHPANATVGVGKTVTFSVTAVGSNLSYQWQFSKNNGQTWSNWAGKTAATLPVTGSATNGGCLYRCVVKNSCGSVTSDPAKLTVR